MIPYITYREEGADGLKYFIVQKSFPYWRAVITLYPLDNKIAQSIPITGYNLYTSFAGTIEGNRIPFFTNVEKEAQAVLQRMAEWFLENRIKLNPKKYKKWLKG